MSDEMPQGQWLTTPELMEALVEAGVGDVTTTMLARWRQRNLLGKVSQQSTNGRGSTVRHPPDTLQRVKVIRQLQSQKDDLSWIGRQLWWSGQFEMAEGIWRPQFTELADTIAPELRKLRTLVEAELAGSESQKPIAERLVRHFQGNSVTSRVLRRVPPDQLEPVLRVLSQIAAGYEPEYEFAIEPNGLGDDQRLLIQALGLGNSEKHALLGLAFDPQATLFSALAALARAVWRGNLGEAARADRAEIEAARDDIRAVLEVASAIYKSTRWIYGDDALGLRLANWLAHKSSPEILRLMILIWVLARRSNADFLASAEIATLRLKILDLAVGLHGLKIVYDHSPEFSNILNRKRIKSVLSGETPYQPFVAEVDSLALRIEKEKACEVAGIDTA